MKRQEQVCKPKEGREPHRKVKRKRKRERKVEVQRIVRVYPWCARILSRGRVCRHARVYTSRKRTEAASLQDDERHEANEREKEGDRREEGDRKRERKREMETERQKGREKERARARARERENLFEDSWV